MMQIFVNGYVPSDFKKSLKIKIENNEIRTWKFVKDDGYERLLHTGDEQYLDVVVRLVAPSAKEKEIGIKYTKFTPTVRETIKGVDAIKTATSPFGVVLGRFAEELNCHYTEIGEYKTVL